MSAVAGSMAPLVGAYYLAKFNGGRGTLLGTLLGEPHGKVVIIGDGVVGRHACDVASALGAHVTVFGMTPERAADVRATPRGSAICYRPRTSIAAQLPMPICSSAQCCARAHARRTSSARRWCQRCRKAP